MLTKIKDKKFSILRLINKPGLRIMIEDIGNTFVVFNGKEYFSLYVDESMIGYYYRDFRFTKLTGNRIHVKRTKKQKKKR